MRLHAAVWVWGGTVMIALFALAVLFFVHGQAKVALSLFFGANVIGVFVWLLGTSFRRTHPSNEEEEDSGGGLLDQLKDNDEE